MTIAELVRSVAGYDATLQVKAVDRTDYDVDNGVVRGQRQANCLEAGCLL